MPSFRVRFTVSTLKPGHQPAEVLPAARMAVPASAHCDDVRLDIQRMCPVITVRFTIAGSNDQDEDARAWTCGYRIRESMDHLALLSAPVVLRRTGQRWTPLRDRGVADLGAARPLQGPRGREAPRQADS